MCSLSSPSSLNCRVGAMAVFRKLCRVARSSTVHITESGASDAPHKALISTLRILKFGEKMLE